MTTLKRRVALAVERAGFQIHRVPGPRTIERHLRDLLEDLAIDCVIDVGANEGQFARSLRSLGYERRIASVEPATATFDRLQAASAGDAEWVAFHCALGDERGEATLLHASTDDFSSLHAFNEYAQERFGRTTVGSETVAVSTLTDRWDELTAGCERIYLKSDTQGHDLAVVRGLGERRPLAIQVELAFTPIYNGIPTAAEVIAHLDNLGYGLSDLFPITRSADRRRIVEADGIFVTASPTSP